MNQTYQDGNGGIERQIVDNGDGTATVYGQGGQAGGQVIDTIDVPLPDTPATSPVAEAVAAARTAVAGLAPTGATRRAVEALAYAVEQVL